MKKKTNNNNNNPNNNKTMNNKITINMYLSIIESKKQTSITGTES